MKLYIMTIAVSAIVAAAVNMLSPEKWQKYISVVTGLVMVLCIGRPIFELAHTDVFSGFHFNNESIADEGERQLRMELKKELELQLAGDVQSRIRQEFGRTAQARVRVGVDDGGLITGVESIVIYGKGFDNAVTGRLRDVYGAREVKIGGNKKVSEKAE